MSGMSTRARVSLALRNILKNRRRSLLTILSVAIGYIALSLFEGYFMYVYRILEDQAIIGERLGHITITKKGFLEKGVQEPRKYAFDKKELAKAQDILSEYDEVKLVSPKLSVSGLVSNGQITRIFVGDSIAPKDIDALRGEQYADLPGRLDPNDPYAGVFGEKLTQYLDTEVGGSLSLVASTIDGMVNAIDITVGEATNTGSSGSDDKSILMSLELARKLLLFDGADRISVLLQSKDQIPSVGPALVKRLQEAGMDVEYHEWSTLSQYYAQVKGLFDVMYLFIMIVVAVVVMFSVANTLGMSIAERTREIGTLRALGARRSNVIGMFIIEGVTMVAIGIVVGLVVTYLLGYGINAADITYVPPDSSVEAELKIDLIPENLFGSAFTMIVLAALVSWLPSRRAGRMQIVDALSHV